jgi:hypothetical protein
MANPTLLQDARSAQAGAEALQASIDSTDDQDLIDDLTSYRDNLEHRSNLAVVKWLLSTSASQKQDFIETFNTEVPSHNIVQA